MAKSGLDVTMTLPRGLVRRLDRYAKVQGLSRSAAARELLGSALADGEDFVRLMANDKVRGVMLEALAKPGVVRAIAACLGEELSEADREKVLRLFQAASSAERPPFEVDC